MSFRKYATSRSFFIQVVAAITVIVLLVFICMYWLTFTTLHGEEISVPDLSKLSEEQAEEKLNELELNYIILDSVDYVKEYPKYSVVQQDPRAGAKVKKGRKIYLKINSSGFTSMRMPNLIEKTYRQAVPTLLSLGLEEGKITYKPYLGKDMVLEMWHNGKKLKPGDKVQKSSKIDLVLGDGKVGFDESDIDTAPDNVDYDETADE
ncbi:MAG: PASTA domain-containing protein [Flavobacterium sp.]|nr:PASTA domain-containing protein [Flavobacterium sp.]